LPTRGRSDARPIGHEEEALPLPVCLPQRSSAAIRNMATSLQAPTLPESAPQLGSNRISSLLLQATTSARRTATGPLTSNRPTGETNRLPNTLGKGLKALADRGARLVVLGQPALGHSIAGRHGLADRLGQLVSRVSRHGSDVGYGSTIRSLVGWLFVILVLLLIVIWGVTAVGLPQNPAAELAPLATQVALPQSKDPNDALAPLERLALQRDLVEYTADSRVRTWTLLAQVIGGAVLAIGGVATWRNLQGAQENARVGRETLRVTQNRLDIDRQAQITNRFTQAIGQLGAELKDGEPNLEVRLGGIYALERIARDSAPDQWTIMEFLTAYVRRNAPWPPRSITPVTSPSAWRTIVSKGRSFFGFPSPALWTPRTVSRTNGNNGTDESAEAKSLRTDIQAILTVLGRRLRSGDRVETGWLGLELSGMDLSNTDLEGANLMGADLEKATLVGAHLERAFLRDAHLDRANLWDAHLEGANLRDAHLEGAVLYGADLSTAEYLKEDQLRTARSWQCARLPPGLANLQYETDEKPTDFTSAAAPPTPTP
jgi:Pentapeptide repeats (8 copies)